MRENHGPLGGTQLWSVFTIVFIVFVALLVLVLATTALR